MISKHTINLTNKVFDRLLVLKFANNRGQSKHSYWLCKCSCGKEVEVRGSHLRSGSVKSCGCYGREVASKLLYEYATSEKHKGEGNPMWKGDDAKHAAIHTWLNKNGTKKQCRMCGAKSKLDFALVKGLIHSHNLKNYITLCRKCHIHYDKE